MKSSADSKSAVVLEINCETDFVAKNEDFIAFADAVAQSVLDSGAFTLDEALSSRLAATGVTVDGQRKELVAKLGENINVRRFERFVSEQGVDCQLSARHPHRRAGGDHWRGYWLWARTSRCMWPPASRFVWMNLESRPN